jgi:Rad3-related DNA helicase
MTYELGLFINDVAKSTDYGGILVFFPSYSKLTAAMKLWSKGVGPQKAKIIPPINFVKDIKFEPKSHDEMAA